MNDAEREKRAVGEAAAQLIEPGTTVGLGTGSTVAYFLEALAARKLDLRCVATSPRTEEAAASLGLQVKPFDDLERLDMAVDGADQVDAAGWVVKGGGAAHTREKIVAAAAERFLVIVSSDKVVDRLAPPIPLELLPFGVHATLRALGHAELRDAPSTPDGGLIADYLGPVDDPGELSTRLDGVPGVVAHGLFAPHLVSEVLVGRGADVDRLL